MKIQLSENIRTGRQLIIVFVMHSIEILVACIIFGQQQYFNFGIDTQLFVQLYWHVVTVANLIIVIAIIA
jgi:hypothetical protein